MNATPRRPSRRRRLNIALGAVAAAYVIVHAFPTLIFHHAMTVDGVTVHAREPLPAATRDRLRTAIDLLKKSELHVAGHAENIFICNSHTLFVALAPGHGDSFAYSLPITNNVFVHAADIDADVVRRAGPDYNTRSFSAVVAHEITHGMIRRHTGLLRGVALPAWIAEGYCDYVANESSFPEAEGRALLATGRTHPSRSFQYFTYRNVVRFQLEERHLSFDKLVDRAGDYEACKREMTAALSAQ